MHLCAAQVAVCAQAPRITTSCSNVNISAVATSYCQAGLVVDLPKAHLYCRSLIASLILKMVYVSITGDCRLLLGDLARWVSTGYIKIWLHAMLYETVTHVRIVNMGDVFLMT